MDRTLQDIAEEWLVVEAQCGDAQAWRLLVERWDARLRRQVVRHLGTGDSDVVQEVWVAVARGLNRLDDPARFGPWVYRILACRCADHVRRRMRKRKIERVRPTEPSPPPDDEIEILRLALRRLDPEERFVLCMRHADGLSIRAISRVLGIKQGTVKSRLSAARERLRELLAEMEQDSV